MEAFRLEVVKTKFSKRLQGISKAQLCCTAQYTGWSPLLPEIIKASSGSFLMVPSYSLEKVEFSLFESEEFLETSEVIGTGSIEKSDLFVFQDDRTSALEHQFLPCQIFQMGQPKEIAKIYFKVIYHSHADCESEVATKLRALDVSLNLQERINKKSGRNSFILPHFRFQRLCKHVNWNNVQALNVEKLIENCDYQTLLICMIDVCKGDVTKEDEVDSQLLQAITVAQLSSQYLYSSLNLLREKGIRIKGAQRILDFEEDRLDQEMIALRARNKSLTDEVANLDEMNQQQVRLLSALDPILMASFERNVCSRYFKDPQWDSESHQSEKDKIKQMETVESEKTDVKNKYDKGMHRGKNDIERIQDSRTEIGGKHTDKVGNVSIPNMNLEWYVDETKCVDNRYKKAIDVENFMEPFDDSKIIHRKDRNTDSNLTKLPNADLSLCSRKGFEISIVDYDEDDSNNTSTKMAVTPTSEASPRLDEGIPGHMIDGGSIVQDFKKELHHVESLKQARNDIVPITESTRAPRLITSVRSINSVSSESNLPIMSVNEEVGKAAIVVDDAGDRVPLKYEVEGINLPSKDSFSGAKAVESLFNEKSLVASSSGLIYDTNLNIISDSNLSFTFEDARGRVEDNVLMGTSKLSLESVLNTSMSDVLGADLFEDKLGQSSNKSIDIAQQSQT